MFKKLICITLSAVSLFALCSCNGNNKPEETTETTTAYESFIISKENVNLLEKGAEIAVDSADKYCLLKYDGAQYLAKELKSGNFDAVYKIDGSFELLDEATKRAEGQYIYFIHNGALKAYYIANNTVLTVVKAPCSNFITLNVTDKFEIYPYGFIASGNEICVINLKSASLSSYTKSISDVSLFFDPPTAFMAENVKTTLQANSKKDIKITVETFKNGKVKDTTEIIFTPLIGVFQEIV